MSTHTTLFVPFLFRRKGSNDYVASHMKSHDIFSLETACSVGSKQASVHICEGLHLSFYVKEVIEYNEENGRREVFADEKRMRISIDGEEETPIWPAPDESDRAREVLKRLFDAGWTNPAGNWEKYRQ